MSRTMLLPTRTLTRMPTRTPTRTPMGMHQGSVDVCWKVSVMTAWPTANAWSLVEPIGFPMGVQIRTNSVALKTARSSVSFARYMGN